VGGHGRQIGTTLPQRPGALREPVPGLRDGGFRSGGNRILDFAEQQVEAVHSIGEVLEQPQPACERAGSRGQPLAGQRDVAQQARSVRVLDARATRSRLERVDEQAELVVQPAQVSRVHDRILGDRLAEAFTQRDQAPDEVAAVHR
jgi:hypothetical protein